MSKLSGIVVILAGLGAAAYTLPSRVDTAPPQPGEASNRILADATEVAIATLPAPKPAMRPEPPASVQTAWPPIRPFATTTERAAAPPARVPQPSAIVGPPLDRAGLTRELQRELRRVGCYDGDVNGVWTPAARRSMKAFTDRVNATLPIEQPDYILLAMLQNHQDKACGRTCPTGQGLSGDGRCLPNAIIARAATKHVPAVPPPVASASSALDKRLTAESSWNTSATALPSPPAGRMALAGPNSEQAPTGSLAGEQSPAAASAPAPDAAAAPTAAAQRPKSPKRSARSRGRRPLGAWIFSDAPVDRVLGR